MHDLPRRPILPRAVTAAPLIRRAVALVLLYLAFQLSEVLGECPDIVRGRPDHRETLRAEAGAGERRYGL
jgi:hypothetical protein